MTRMTRIIQLTSPNNLRWHSPKKIRDETIPRPDAMLKALVEKNFTPLGIGVYHITLLRHGFAELFER